MSSRKRQKTSSKVKKSMNLFNERICDDLSEVILQYLPLEDKLRLEGVSKRFQTTVFKRHNVLKVEGILLEKKKKINLKVFEGVLKKSKDITEIDFSKTNITKVDSNAIIELILDFCPHLTQMNLDFRKLNRKTFEKFVEKFGPKLKSLSVGSLYEDIPKSFPNIQELCPPFDTRKPKFNLSDISKFEFKNLKKLVVYYSGKDLPQLESFVKKYKSLKHLTVIAFKCKFEAIKQLLKQMSNLKELIHFELKPYSVITKSNPFGNDIFFGFGMNGEEIANLLNQMAEKCPKLKSFGAFFTVDADDSENMNQLFAPFLAFNQLKRLDLKLRFDPEVDWYDQISEDHWFEFKSLEGNQVLTHLSLHIYELQNMNAAMIDNISRYLPNLEYFELSNVLYSPEHLPYAIAQLKRLKTLRLVVRTKPVGEKLKKFIKENNKSLENMSYSVRSPHLPFTFVYEWVHTGAL